MCGYSLEHYKTRDAAKDDELILRKFPSGTQGFTRVNETDCATCLKEGAELMVKLPNNQSRRALFDTLPVGSHRDALIFENQNTPLSLQELPVETMATVLSIGGGQVVMQDDSVKRELVTA